MIRLLGSNFGFAWPWALAAIPLGLAILIYAYLKRGREPERLVATLMLLRFLKRGSVARKRFIPPARFFFELLLLALLAAGAAGAFRENKQHTLAILIDNSFSMAALDLSDPLAAPLLSAAKKEAASLLESQGSQVKAKVYVTSPFVRSLSGDFESYQAAEQRLSSINIAFAPDGLEAALGKLVADPTLRQVAVFSDRARFSSSMSPQQIALLADRIRLKPIGSPERRLQNIALSDISFAPNSLNQAPVLKCTLSNFSLETVKVKTSLEAFLEEGSTPIEEKIVVIPKLGSAAVVFENLPQKSPAFRIDIRPWEASQASLVDVIREDDTAWISRPFQSQKVTLVGNFNANDLGLDKIPTIDFEGLKPAAYEARLQSGAEAKLPISAQIFHRYAPPVWPAYNSLLILPPPGNKLLEVGAALNSSSSTQITHWEGSHPILKYLNLPALNLTTLYPLRPLPWSVELLRTSAGTAALAGEFNDRHYAVLGFEILPFEGKANPFLSILTLNLLRWLADVTAGQGFQPTYVPYKFSGQKVEAVYTGEKNPLPPLAGGQQKELSYSFPRPGLVKLTSENQPPRLVAVNFFDEKESNTLESKELNLPASAAVSLKTESLEQYKLTRLLGLVVLVLTLLDLAYQAAAMRRKLS